ARLNEERLAALFLGQLIQPAGRFINRELHLEHLAEAGLEHGQRAGNLLLAKLPQDFLQLGLGLFQLFAGGPLILGRFLPLGLFQLLLGILHLLLGLFQALASRVGILLVLLLLLLLV